MQRYGNFFFLGPATFAHFTDHDPGDSCRTRSFHFRPLQFFSDPPHFPHSNLDCTSDNSLLLIVKRWLRGREPHLNKHAGCAAGNLFVRVSVGERLGRIVASRSPDRTKFRLRHKWKIPPVGQPGTGCSIAREAVPVSVGVAKAAEFERLAAGSEQAAPAAFPGTERAADFGSRTWQ